MGGCLLAVRPFREKESVSINCPSKPVPGTRCHEWALLSFPLQSAFPTKCATQSQPSCPQPTQSLLTGAQSFAHTGVPRFHASPPTLAGLSCPAQTCHLGTGLGLSQSHFQHDSRSWPITSCSYNLPTQSLSPPHLPAPAQRKCTEGTVVAGDMSCVCQELQRESYSMESSPGYITETTRHDHPWPGAGPGKTWGRAAEPSCCTVLKPNPGLIPSAVLKALQRQTHFPWTLWLSQVRSGVRVGEVPVDLIVHGGRV